MREFNLRRALVVTKKDLLEFKRNRYILFTLLFTPVIISVMIPVSSIMPIMAFYTDNGDFSYSMVQYPETYFNLNESGLPPGYYPYLDRYYVDGYDLNYFSTNQSVIVNSSLGNAMVMNSVVESSNLSNDYILNSFILNSTLDNCTLINCTVFNSSLVSTLKIDSRIYDSEEPGSFSIEDYVNMIVDSMLLLFILIPAILPTVIASYSFIGEKAGKTLEPVLATPITDGELFAGKSLAIFIPTMLATYAGFILFVILVDIMTAPIMGVYLLPNATWLVGIMITSPLFCILAIELNVFISTRVNDVRASQQIGGTIVLPVVILFIMGTMGLIKADAFFLLLLSAVILLIDLAVFKLAVRMFQRERILIQWK